ncbi:MAG TPA: FtsX-like permease family protein [Rudaea sp.]|jgi:putative ABC transport system permease protein|nr:FtsX-like permease family protein [Rudaea sp.]
MKPMSFAWRTLRREFRYGELATLAIALILAVAALGAVATLGERVQRSVVASASEFIGGDVGLSSREPPSDELKAEAARLNVRTSTAATFPTVLFAGGKSQLADIRAADAAYPLRGELRVRSASGAEFSAHTPPSGSVYAEQRLLAALDLKTGDELQIGDRTLRIAGEIEREPDGGELFALAPRVVMSLDDARAGGLLAVGSRARYRLMAAGDERAIAEFTTFLKSHKPDSGELITVEQSQQNLKSAFDRGDAFLRLAALLAALLSGIAVALASQRYARRKTDEVALLRCLGASGGEVTLAIAMTLAILAVPACAIGALLGLGLQQVVFTLAKDLLPVASNVIPLAPTAASFAVGLAVLFGFALPPLLRLRDVPPVRIFQRAAGARVRRFDVLYLIPFAVSALLIFVESDTPKLATILSASLFGVAAVALIAGLLLMRVVRGARGLAGALRFGLANLVRRRALSLLQIVALALAITALDLLAVVGPSLLSAWRAELPPNTPNYFLINIQPEQLDGVSAALKQAGAENINTLPLAVSKLVAINGTPPRAEDYADRRAAGWINGETRMSWSAEVPPSNRVIQGKWFDAHPSEPEISVDEMWVDMFHLKLGDTLTLRVGDRDIVARVTSVRGVRWDSFRVNFFLLLDPQSAQGISYSDIASFHLPPDSANALSTLSRDYPNVSMIDLNALLDRIRDIIARVGTAVTAVLAFSLAAGILVLFAALAATADERRFESALLRTLGAHRAQLVQAVLAEFAVMGLLAGIIAAVGAGGAGMWLARSVFRISAYVPPMSALTLSIIAGALLVALAGLAGTRKLTRTSPLLVLRRA